MTLRFFKVFQRVSHLFFPSDTESLPVFTPVFTHFPSLNLVSPSQKHLKNPSILSVVFLSQAHSKDLSTFLHALPTEHFRPNSQLILPKNTEQQTLA